MAQTVVIPTHTLYAAFDDAGLAERAAGALLDHGVRSEDISIVSSKMDETGTNTGYTSRTAETDVNREPVYVNPDADGRTYDLPGGSMPSSTVSTDPARNYAVSSDRNSTAVANDLNRSTETEHSARYEDRDGDKPATDPRDRFRRRTRAATRPDADIGRWLANCPQGIFGRDSGYSSSRPR